MLADPAPVFHLYWDTVIPPLVVGGIIGLMGWVYLSRTLEARRAAEDEQRKIWMEEIKRTVSGFGERLTGVKEYTDMLRGVVVGINGDNGLKSDVRELRNNFTELDRRGIHLQGRVDNLERNET